MVVWGSDRCIRWHFPPFWIQPLAPWISNHRFCQFDKYLADWQASFGHLSSSDPLPVKQSVWDKPGILTSHAIVESAISDSCQNARFLAAVAPHSGDWLLALPVSSFGLRLSDEAVRVAVAVRLGSSVCVPHTCRRSGDSRSGVQAGAW